MILSVGDRHAEYAKAAADRLQEQGFRVRADVSAEKIGAKVRHHLWQEKVPMVAVVGDREVETQTLTVRHRTEGELGSLDVGGVATLLADQVHSHRRARR